ncbi:PEP-CTERM sorting domain-containing protein [Photobacterium sanctipauli]|uniref:PEP-CTERM sorting domain-containing protein n=1 Tax=Photobacterium sanctipauli TaxID=1342794 RepID=A0A2T3NX76_9GAMM|nr:PEP-CTERM sorting domain-containing protein [Photobacterium sanctipauli]PSW20809.1 PEP-CTERM sorting domain-containing protein [Photobacterium sanctipauli]
MRYCAYLFALILGTISINASAGWIQFDDNDGMCTDTVLSNEHSVCEDYAASQLTFDVDGGTLTVAGGTSVGLLPIAANNVIQDIDPINGGLGNNGRIDGESTGNAFVFIEFLQFTFDFDVLISGIQFNDGNHGDTYIGNEPIGINLSSYAVDGDGYAQGVDIALSQGESLFVYAMNWNSVYVEALNFGLASGQATVPEPTMLSLFGLGLLGLYRRRSRNT